MQDALLLISYSMLKVAYQKPLLKCLAHKDGLPKINFQLVQQEYGVCWTHQQIFIQFGSHEFEHASFKN